MIRGPIQRQEQAITSRLFGGGAGWYFGSDLAWQRNAACARTDDPEKFFPNGGRPSNQPKRLCAGCPVRDECLDWAISHEEQGMWGGLTKVERDRLVASRLALPFMKETK